VTLLEERSRLGGATFSIERDGLWIDNGQHVFLRCCTEYRRLLARLGVTEQATLQSRLAIPVLRPGRRVSWLRRAPLPTPLHLAPSLARFGALPVSDRLRLLPAVRALGALSLDDPSLDQQTVDALWNLITLPTVNLDASEASLALAAKVFQTGLLDDADAADVGYAGVPLQRLHGDAAGRALAAAGVDVRLRARAQAVATGDGTISVAWSGGAVAADAAVVAVPHDDAGKLVPRDVLPRNLDPARLGFSPIVNLHVVYDRPVTGLPFAAALMSPVQWVFDRTDSSGLKDGQYLAVSLSGADRYLDRTVDELRAEFEPALAELLPAVGSAQVTSFFATREPHATFRGVPGTAAHRPRARTALPGLYLAGAWTDTGWPATMEGAVRSGLAAADAALADSRPHVRGEAA
jgi:squalene-associated FAD-dependent desaturase